MKVNEITIAKAVIIICLGAWVAFLVVVAIKLFFWLF